MQHAFLIIAHNNWDQLCKLIQQIDASNHDIYIHIDKKSKDVPMEKIRKVPQYSKITIYSKFKVYWGGILK